MLPDHKNSTDTPQDFQFLANSIPQLVWVTEPDGNHIYYNQRWYAFTGLDYEQSRNQGWSLVLHPEDYQRTLQVWQHSLATGEPYQIEYRFKRHDGVYRWFLGQALPQRDQADRILKWFGTCTDIHEQKLMQGALQESGQREKAILEAEQLRLYHLFMRAPAGVALLEGPDLVYRMANEVYYQILGRTSVILGKPGREAFPEGVEQGIWDLLDGVYSSGEAYVGKDFRAFIDIDGRGELSEQYYDFVFQPVKEAESVTAILITALNVTHQVQARKALLEREAYFREMADSVPVMIRVTRPDGYCTYLNKPWYDYTGQSEQEGLGLGWLQATHPEDFFRSQEAFLSANAQQGPFSVLYRLKGKDGVYRWFLDKAEPKFDAAGSFAGYVGAVVEVDEQQRAEQRLQLSVKAGKVGLFEWDIEQDRARHSDLLQEMLGLETGKFPGDFEHAFQAYQKVILPQDRDRFNEQLEKTFSSQEREFYVEFQVVRPGGAVVWIAQRGELVYEGLKPVRMNGTCIDITQRKQGEKELLESQQQLQQVQAKMLAAAQQQAKERENFYQVFEQAPVIVALLRGPEHFFYYRNPAFQALFPGRELTGHLCVEVMPEIVAAGLMAELNKVYATGQTYYGTELPLIATPPDGAAPHERYYDFSYQAYRENGEIVGISIFAYDVTERVRARQEREAQRQQLEELFMQAPAPIAILDGAERVYELINPAMQQIFPGRQLLGKTLLVAQPELADTPIPGILDQVYRTGETFVAHELLLMMARHEGGELEKIYWTFIYQARRDTQGAVNGIMVFAHEVTDQVSARQQVEGLNRELAAAIEELQAANEEIQSTNEELGITNTYLKRTNADLDNFIYTASHDLKAPITNIEGLMQNLWRSLPADILAIERVVRIRTLMQDSVDRFKKTIASLTEIVKLQKENSTAALLVDLAAVIREVLLDLEPMMGATGTQVTIDVAACPEVRFSEKNLRSVVYNLLSNAIKYRSPERVPQVRIYCESTSEYHVLTVSDNGLGMESGRLNQLFTMFKRFHDHVEGSGIGLYMIKKMVENAGGRIEVESQVGVGSTFRVYFPY